MADRRRHIRCKKKRRFGKDSKEAILCYAERAAEIGCSMRSFARAIKISRSVLYFWKERKGRWERPRKASILRIGMAKIKQILEITERYKEVASEYMVAVKCGVSPTTVGKARKLYLPKPVTSIAIRIKKSYQWLKRHVCWSMDTMYIKYADGWLYLIVLLEEYSRKILGWRLCEYKRWQYAAELLNFTMINTCVRPLLIKHDRGREFMDDGFQKNLLSRDIISLASPGHYAPFNSRMESANRILRKFTRSVEDRRNAGMDEFFRILSRAQHIINDELPRRIFNGRTSSDIYNEGQDWTEEDRINFLQEICQKRELINSMSGKNLDKTRKEVVELLQGIRLCRVEPVGYTVNQL